MQLLGQIGLVLLVLEGDSTGWHASSAALSLLTATLLSRCTLNALPLAI